MTRSAWMLCRLVSTSSWMPSAKKAFSASGLRLVKGKTPTDLSADGVEIGAEATLGERDQRQPAKPSPTATIPSANQATPRGRRCGDPEAGARGRSGG